MRRFYQMWRATSFHVHRSETRAQGFSLEFSFPLIRFLSFSVIYSLCLPLILSLSSRSPFFYPLSVKCQISASFHSFSVFPLAADLRHTVHMSASLTLTSLSNSKQANKKKTNTKNSSFFFFNAGGQRDEKWTVAVMILWKNTVIELSHV